MGSASVRPKTKAGYRDFAISPQPAKHLDTFLCGRNEGLLFMARSRRPGVKSKVVEKRLSPPLLQLGITCKGLNGFRHYNASQMDAQNIPVKVRQTRLSHDDPRVTLGTMNKGGYTHLVGVDDRRAAAMFGDMFSVLCPDAARAEMGAKGNGSESNEVH